MSAPGVPNIPEHGDVPLELRRTFTQNYGDLEPMENGIVQQPSELYFYSK